MALSVGRFAVARMSSGHMGSERKQGNNSLNNIHRQCNVSVSRCSSSRLVTRRQLHAIATNSRVLELEGERESLEFLPEPEVAEVEKAEDPTPSGPSAHEIHNLLMQVCDETSSITEVQLKVGTFSLRVRREIGKAAKPVASGPPVLGKAMVDYTPADAAPSAPSKSSKLAKTPPSKATAAAPVADGGLLFVASPKVGLFRQGRTVKGKSGPPLCAEGLVVKKGQVVCYLEQLGTQQPVEADIDGEVEKVLCKDGEPVGYGDRLIAIRP